MSDECKFKPTERFGLYFMVFWIFLDCNSCDMTAKIKKMEVQLNSIEQKIDVQTLQTLQALQSRNVIDVVAGLSTNNITHKATIPLEK